MATDGAHRRSRRAQPPVKLGEMQHVGELAVRIAVGALVALLRIEIIPYWILPRLCARLAVTTTREPAVSASFGSNSEVSAKGAKVVHAPLQLQNPARCGSAAGTSPRHCLSNTSMRGSCVASSAARRTEARSARSSGRCTTSPLPIRLIASRALPASRQASSTRARLASQHPGRLEANAGVGPGDDETFARLIRNVRLGKSTHRAISSCATGAKLRSVAGCRAGGNAAPQDVLQCHNPCCAPSHKADVPEPARASAGRDVPWRQSRRRKCKARCHRRRQSPRAGQRQSEQRPAGVMLPSISTSCGSTPICVQSAATARVIASMVALKDVDSGR